jgi:dTDP-4-dehydrorhamnose reductase
MKIVILGAGGQVGRAVARLGGQQAVDVLSLGREQLDITDSAAVIAALQAAEPSIVVNAAAYTKVDAAEANRALSFEVNRDGAAIVAGACHRFRLPLVHLSTDYVFDGQKRHAYVESDPIGPLNIYGESKEAGERAVRQCHDHHVILRTAWVFGSDGANFLKTVLRLAETRDEWGVVDDQLGTPTSTADLAAAILCVATQAARGADCWGLYHFAGSEDATWYDFATEIIEAWWRRTGRRPTIRRLTSAEYPTSARRPRNSRLDSRLFEARFGVRAAPLGQRVEQAVGVILAKP